MQTEAESAKSTFESLGLCKELLDAVRKVGYTTPTEIQRQSIPYGIEGRDLICLAETGSGKTASFALPVIHRLLQNPQPYFALVLAPTRELAYQIEEHFNALGAPLGVKSLTIVGGLDMMTQAIGLAKKPHVIIGTPGRLVDHLQNTKGFTLDRLKFLVFDEADRLLNMEFEKEINQILEIAPKERTTFLFSATMTSQVAKLQKASLRSPVKLEVSQSKYQTVKTLIQNYVFVPAKHKDCYLVYMLSEEFSGSSTIIFTDTVRSTQKLTIMLRNLGFQAVPLHGKMTQPKRLGALNKFKSGASSSGNYILIATDVASRGLDIPSVDLVVNYDIPTHSKDYIHRVGRTARAGRSGRSLTMVTQYDVELYQRIEALIEKKMDLYPLEPERVLVFAERVSEAQRMATIEMRDLEEGKGKKNDFLSAEKFFKKKTEKSRKQK